MENGGGGLGEGKLPVQRCSEVSDVRCAALATLDYLWLLIVERRKKDEFTLATVYSALWYTGIYFNTISHVYMVMCIY